MSEHIPAQQLAALPPAAAQLAALLDLAPLPHEGGLFRRTHIDEHSSAIYYMLAAPDFSALHSLTEVEVYHWYAGSPLRLLLLYPDGHGEEVLVGPDVAAGEHPQFVVPAGVMQGSSPAGEWCLVGTTMAPPFQWDGFTLGERDALLRRYPAFAERIIALTRDAA